MLECDAIDAVDVCLHNNMHASRSIRVMKAGKDCYCESRWQVRIMTRGRMYESCGNRRKLQHKLSLFTATTQSGAERFIDAGNLGHIYHMRSYGFRRRGRPYVDGYARKEFVNTVTSGGGALFDMGVYHISQLLYLTGLPKLERVTGRTYAEIAMDEGRRKISGFNVEELGVGFASYENGLSMDILESWAIHGKPFPASAIRLRRRYHILPAHVPQPPERHGN